LFGVKNKADAVTEVLLQWGRVQIQKEETSNGTESLFTLTSKADEDIRPELFSLAVEKGWTLTELHQDQVNLEDVFRQLTSE